MSRLAIKIDGTYVPNKDKGYSSYDVVQKLGRLEDLEEQGRLITVIRCKDCTEYNPWGFKEGFGWCEEFDRVTIDDDYCSNAEAELKGTEE
jgi:hypothetical protein